jgi:hypothetical protein
VKVVWFKEHICVSRVEGERERDRARGVMSMWEERYFIFSGNRLT